RSFVTASGGSWSHGRATRSSARAPARRRRSRWYVISIPTSSCSAALRLTARAIVLTPSLRHERIFDAVQRGARGVISTHTAADVLFQTIEVVMSGGVWIGLGPAPEAVSVSPRRFAKACLRPNAF